MKKPKMLVATLAAAVMLMGAGYAYWNQTITINNTVATGNLDVQFVSGATVKGYDDVGCSDRVIVTPPVIAVGGQSMTFKVENMYPGAGASLNFVIKNTGSVDAKVSGVSATYGYNPTLANALEYQVDTAVVTDSDGNKSEKDIGVVYATTPAILATALSNNDLLKNITLAPGDTLQLVCTKGYDSRRGGGGGGGNGGGGNGGSSTVTSTPGYDVMMSSEISGSAFEKQTTTFDLGIAFTQSNAQPGDL